MALLGLSFIAGVLTVLAPCVLPLLPVIIGGSTKQGKHSRPRVIIASFAVSVLVFTLLIKRFADTLGVFPDDLTQVAAIILILFGVVLLFPQLRQQLMHLTGIDRFTQKAQHDVSQKHGPRGDILMGVVLGPIFNTCSPTYAALVGTILPASFARGLLNILVYILGLVVVLAAIAYGGRAVVNKLKRASNPNGLFKKIIAGLLIIVGVAILFKRDKTIETRLIQNDYIIDTTAREVNALKQTQNK